MVGIRPPPTRPVSKIYDIDPPPYRTDADAVTFLDLKPGQTVVASVPHSDASAYHYMVCISQF